MQLTEKIDSLQEAKHLMKISTHKPKFEKTRTPVHPTEYNFHDNVTLHLLHCKIIYQVKRSVAEF